MSLICLVLFLTNDLQVINSFVALCIFQSWNGLRSPLQDLKYLGMVSMIPPDEMHTMNHLLWKRTVTFISDAQIKPARYNVRVASATAEGDDSGNDDDNDEVCGVPRRAVISADTLVTRIQILDSLLELLGKVFVPTDFARPLTPSRLFGEYKCAQWRQLGLYVSVGLFEGLLDKAHLRLICFSKVFHLLFLGLCGAPPSEADLDVAHQTVEFFLSEFFRLKSAPLKKGEVISVPYCYHLALHIVRYVQNLGVSYNKLSAFGYENYICDLVPSMRSTNKLLEQIVNCHRRRELYVLNCNSDETIMYDASGQPSYGWGGWSGNSKVRDATRFRLNTSKKVPSFEYKNISVSVKFADSWVLVCSNPDDKQTYSNPLVFRITKFVASGTAVSLADGSRPDRDLSQISIQGYFYPRTKDLYSQPFPSSLKHEIVFENERALQLAELPIEAITFKMYVFPRFSSLPLKVLNGDDLGGPEFSNVPEWIGVAIRH